MEIKYFWKNNHGLEREDRKHDTDNNSYKRDGSVNLKPLSI